MKSAFKPIPFKLPLSFHFFILVKGAVNKKWEIDIIYSLKCPSKLPFQEQIRRIDVSHTV